MTKYPAEKATGFLFLSAALLLVLGCQPHRLDEAYEPRPDRRDLEYSLTELDLDNTDYGRLWLDSVDIAGPDPEIVELPYSSSHVFDPMAPEARVLEVTLEEDGIYAFSVDPESGGYVFLDLYRRRGERFVHVATRAKAVPEIVLDLRREGDYRLVVQPEPMRGGRMELRIERRG